MMRLLTLSGVVRAQQGSCPARIEACLDHLAHATSMPSSVSGRQKARGSIVGSVRDTWASCSVIGLGVGEVPGEVRQDRAEARGVRR